MKHFFVKLGITVGIITIFFWFLPTGWWVALLAIAIIVRVFSYFKEKRKAEVALAQAEADFLAADAAINNKVGSDLSTLEKEQKEAKKAREQAKKNATKWTAFTRSNNLDFIIGFLIFVVFLSATISGIYTPEPTPRDLPIVTSFWYRAEKAWLGEKRANELLEKEELRSGEAFPATSGKSWRGFDSWTGVFISLFLLPFLFFWSISDELEKTKKYLSQKDKRGDILKEGDHSSLFYLIAGLAGLHELIQWFHIGKKGSEKK